MEQYITQTPVASLIFVFTVVTSIYAFSNPQVFGKLMLHPYSVSRGQQVHTLLTSGLIHRDWMHLLFNMITFFFFGFQLEKLMAANSSWGHGQFALLYVLSLVLSDLTTVVKHRNHYDYHSLGASGAICAVLFSAILFMPGAKIYLFFILGMPALVFGPLFLIYCVWMARAANDGINHDAHFYGALSGLLITIVLYPGIIPYFLEQIQQILS